MLVAKFFLSLSTSIFCFFLCSLSVFASLALFKFLEGSRRFIFRVVCGLRQFPDLFSRLFNGEKFAINLPVITGGLTPHVIVDAIFSIVLKLL